MQEILWQNIMELIFFFYGKLVNFCTRKIFEYIQFLYKDIYPGRKSEHKKCLTSKNWPVFHLFLSTCWAGQMLKRCLIISHFSRRKKCSWKHIWNEVQHEWFCNSSNIGNIQFPVHGQFRTKPAKLLNLSVFYMFNFNPTKS